MGALHRHQTLIQRYGTDTAMPDVLNVITTCERNAKLSTDRCNAYFEELRAGATPSIQSDHY